MLGTPRTGCQAVIGQNGSLIIFSFRTLFLEETHVTCGEHARCPHTPDRIQTPELSSCEPSVLPIEPPYCLWLLLYGNYMAPLNFHLMGIGVDVDSRDQLAVQKCRVEPQQFSGELVFNPETEARVAGGPPRPP